MRDDRFKGLRLPRHVRKLFEMAGREADRQHSMLMKAQAVKSLTIGGENEISAPFLNALMEHDFHRGLFDSLEIKNKCSSILENEIAHILDISSDISAEKLIEQALLMRGDAWVWELKQIYAMDHETCPDEVESSVVRAFREASASVSQALLRPDRRRFAESRVSLSDDLLGDTYQNSGP